MIKKRSLKGGPNRVEMAIEPGAFAFSLCLNALWMLRADEP